MITLFKKTVVFPLAQAAGISEEKRKGRINAGIAQIPSISNPRPMPALRFGKPWNPLASINMGPVERV
jgi:hypothetical protein